MANISSLFPSQGDAALKSGNLSDLADLTEARANLNTWTTKTAAYTAVDGDWIRAHTSGGAFTITLPASPADGTEIRIADTGHWAINNLTIARNGKTIAGLSEDIVCDVSNVDHSFRYVSTDGNWEVQSNAVTTGDAGQAWTLIETIVASNDASLEFVSGFSSDYSMYLITVDHLAMSADGAALNIRLSDDGGSTWDSGSNYRTQRFFHYHTTRGSDQVTRTYHIYAGGMGNANVQETGASGKIEFFGFGDAADTRIHSVSAGFDAAGNHIVHNVYSQHDPAAAQNGIQILPGSGNIASGTIKLYGVK